MRQTVGTIMALALLTLVAPAPMAADPDQKIETVIVDAYVDGLWRLRDAAAFKAGFHPDFVIQIQRDGEMISATRDEWLARLDLDGKPNTDKIEHRVEVLHRTGHAAVAKVELFENGKLIFTDYLSLYHFEDGWKIVAKIFHGHG